VLRVGDCRRIKRRAARPAVLLIVALSGLLVVQGLAQGAPPVTVTSPSLVPAFNPSIPDYVVHCTTGTPVRVSVSAPSGVTVSVDGQRPRRGPFHVDVKLKPGQSFRFVVGAGQRGRTYSLRCLPPDFPGYTARRPGRPQAAWYVVAPCCSWQYAVIFDNYGLPVWWLHTKRLVLDASLLPNGDVVVGTIATGPIERGTSLARFDEYRLNGRFRRTLTIPGGIPTDRHEVQMLPNGDYIVVAHVSGAARSAFPDQRTGPDCSADRTARRPPDHSGVAVLWERAPAPGR
jgi:hypothetical protein